MSAAHHTSRGGRRAVRASEAPQERGGKRAVRNAADAGAGLSRPAGSRAAAARAAHPSHVAPAVHAVHAIPTPHVAPASPETPAPAAGHARRAAAPVSRATSRVVASAESTGQVRTSGKRAEASQSTRRGRRAAAVAPAVTDVTVATVVTVAPPASLAPVTTAVAGATLATVRELPARGKRARAAVPASTEPLTAPPEATSQPEATRLGTLPEPNPISAAHPTPELKPQVELGRGAAFGVVLPSSLTVAACEAAPARGITTDSEGTEVLSESDIDAAVRAGEARGRAQNRERSDRILAGAAAQWAVARSVSPYRNILIGAVACLGMVLPVMSTLQGNAAQAVNPAFVAPMAEEFTTPAQLTGEVGAIQRAQARTAAENPRRACPTSAGASGTRAAFDIPTDRLIVKPLPEGSYRLTSPFGTRVDPISGEVSSHAGQDFGAPAGTPIHAIADGVVKHAGEGIQGRSNNLIIIEHTINGEKFSSWYIHMYDDGVFVKAGDKVKAGDVIGAVGSNGYSTGPHLHLEIHAANDELLDPLAFLEERQAQPLEADCK
ncbi:peptidoglycan DD-metalloendopeptidase family protein [Actinotignum sanguinis]|uniref:M23 family metallopeptidase n=1 Tax=Actinotignum sanguinis TaxID=1445614 RepID=UPI00254E5D1A|nr:peptidoglycan DD-metalloendopeptidase family protein [Actinotignum sanguinis]MDE1642352.1 peptidoglycan DD-metalloendopeptidase family protein [Actinotignum sanguinis]MDK8518737.1 peptidoglycan DD-metalloendopeptidase family protein [Actinotignum sanguinis]MDK8747994.1 peptidoglycan DD-metalloendopeptidase family protein [Actinotignum sanguinis]